MLCVCASLWSLISCTGRAPRSLAAAYAIPISTSFLSPSETVYLTLSLTLLSPTLSPRLFFLVFEGFPVPTATYGDRERESEWLTETQRKKERGNTLHDQSGYTGLSSAGWADGEDWEIYDRFSCKLSKVGVEKVLSLAVSCWQTY